MNSCQAAFARDRSSDLRFFGPVFEIPGRAGRYFLKANGSEDRVTDRSTDVCMYTYLRPANIEYSFLVPRVRFSSGRLRNVARVTDVFNDTACLMYA